MDDFNGLYQQLLKINLSGTGGMVLPQGAALAKAINRGAGSLPRSYLSGYAQQLASSLPHLQQLVAMQRLDAASLETLAGAVYQHQSTAPQGAALNRFLAVISNLYRSFLDAGKRARANLPQVEQLPPLAMFQNKGDMGPFTITVEQVQSLIASSVGVVSMPATYAAHPLIWAALAHETGGHDVTHADDGLLDELAGGMTQALSGSPAIPGVSAGDLALLWSYWIDEASADVYGLLNIGPSFALNLAAFFAALNANKKTDPPSLRLISGFDPNDPSRMLDPHPTDILRLALACGAIDAMPGLSSATRADYIGRLQTLGDLLARGGTKVQIVGFVPVSRDHLKPLQFQAPLADMANAARVVGRHIATAKLKALDGHSIQEIETWDDADESRATAIRDAALGGQSITALGDDAQLLAGTTLAALQRPKAYDGITRLLNAALDDSFKRDPIWGVPRPDGVYLRYGADPVGAFAAR